MHVNDAVDNFTPYELPSHFELIVEFELRARRIFLRIRM